MTQDDTFSVFLKHSEVTCRRTFSVLQLDTSYDFSFDSLQAFFNHFNYTHVTVFRDDSLRYFSLFARTILDQFRSTALELFENSLELGFYSNTVDEREIDRMLDDARARSRGRSLLVPWELSRWIIPTAFWQ